ncbi:hypothetical protein RJZ57_005027 [Blastomyces gilchristii]
MVTRDIAYSQVTLANRTLDIRKKIAERIPMGITPPQRSFRMHVSDRARGLCDMEHGTWDLVSKLCFWDKRGFRGADG